MAVRAYRAKLTGGATVGFTVQYMDSTPKLTARVASAYGAVLDAAADALIEAIKESVPTGDIIRLPPGHSVGELRESIQELARGNEEVWVGTNLWWAKFVEFGTHAHIIRPKKRRAAAMRAQRKTALLSWMDESGLHTATITHHPGASEHSFMRIGRERGKRQIQRRVGDVLQDKLGLK